MCVEAYEGYFTMLRFTDDLIEQHEAKAQVAGVSLLLLLFLSQLGMLQVQKYKIDMSFNLGECIFFLSFNSFQNATDRYHAKILSKVLAHRIKNYIKISMGFGMLVNINQ